MKTSSYKEHKQEMLKNPEFKKEYDALEAEYSIASAMIRARTKRNMTQGDVAKKLKTTQSVISRVESARTTPTVSFLKRIAKAFDMKLQIRFIPS